MKKDEAEGIAGSDWWASVNLCVQQGSFMLAWVTGQFIVRMGTVHRIGIQIQFSLQIHCLKNIQADMIYICKNSQSQRAARALTVKWVVAQMYKVSRFTFYNISRNRKLGLSPSAGFATDLEYFLPLFLLRQAPKWSAFSSEGHHCNGAPQPFGWEVVPNCHPLIRHWQQELSVSTKVSKNLLYFNMH